LTKLATRQSTFEETVFGQLSVLDSLIREGFDLPEDLAASESDLYDLPEGTISEKDSDSALSFRAAKAKKAKLRPPSPTAGSFVPHPSFAPYFGASSLGSGKPPTAATTSSRPAVLTAGRADQDTGCGIERSSSSAFTTQSSSGAGGDTGRGKLAAKGSSRPVSSLSTLQKEPT